MSIFRKKNKTLIIADDGAGIRGVIAEEAGLSTHHHFPPRTELKKILEFGKEQKVRQVLYLQTADVREIEVKLGTDLNDDERRSAIEFAAASSMGDHSGNFRISFMDGLFRDFRCEIMASYFDTEEIVNAASLIKSMKMRFLGITNFKQLLLAQHFSSEEHSNNAFLFLLGSHGIAAIAERNKLVIRNLPFGIPEPGTEEEWKERVKRRLNSIFRNKRVCLYTPGADEQLCNMLKEISEVTSIEAVDWENTVANAAIFFLQSGHQLIHPALPPPKEKDPKASGTYIGFFFLLATLLSLGFLMGRNCLTKYLLERDIAASQALIDQVQTEKNVLKKLETELVAQQEVFAVMKQKERISKNFLLVMNLLSRYPLQYSRLTSMEERFSGIHIAGESIWQVDLSRFFTHFEGELSKYDLTLFSDGLSKGKDGKILFRSHIAPAGGVKK